MTPGLALRLAIASALLAPAAAGFTPARYLSGSPPAIAVRAVGGGQVFVELTIDEAGRVAAVTPLRDTPPFTPDVVAAVRGWTFTPAVEQKPNDRGDAVTRSVESKVLVAAMYRPPSLNAPTFGEPSKNVAPPSPDVALPASTVSPLFPPNALFDGTVLLECHVGADGRLLDVKVLQSNPAFERSALDAIHQWSFRPARHDGQPVDAYTYVSFAFRQPVTGE